MRVGSRMAVPHPRWPLLLLLLVMVMVMVMLLLRSAQACQATPWKKRVCRLPAAVSVDPNLSDGDLMDTHSAGGDFVGAAAVTTTNLFSAKSYC